MQLLQVSAVSGVLILLLAGLRALFQHRIQRHILLLLWSVITLRLLIPVFIATPLPLPRLFDEQQPAVVQTQADPVAESAQGTQYYAQTQTVQSQGTQLTASTPMPQPEETTVQMRGSQPVLAWIWLCGAVGCLLFFMVSHLLSVRKYRFSVPLPKEVPIPKGLRVRLLDGLQTPLTYGLLRPTVLLPTQLPDAEQLTHILLHEQAHIRCFDLPRKAVLLVAVALHWFNPAVWLLLFLCTQDMEMRCDAMVLDALGRQSRLSYARTLIAAEERRMLTVLHTGFSFSVTNERIKAIARKKCKPLCGILLAVCMLPVLLVGFLTGTVQAKQRPEATPSQAVLTEPALATQPQTEPPTVPEAVPQTEPPTVPETVPETQSETAGQTKAVDSEASWLDSYAISQLKCYGFPTQMEVGKGATGNGRGDYITFYSDAPAVVSVTMQYRPGGFDFSVTMHANAAGTANIYAASGAAQVLVTTITVINPVTQAGLPENIQTEMDYSQIDFGSLLLP